VAEIWERLYQKDWEGLEFHLTPDAHYEDVPAPDAGATGPRDGKLTLWRDYWDIGTLMAQAPKWWLERIASFGDSDFS
jgi:hypothetical protein